MFGRKNQEEDAVDEVIDSVSEEKIEIESYIDKKFAEMTQELEENSSQQIDKMNNTVDKLTNGLNQLLSGMKSELEAVKNIALEKEAKIQRYEEGYDQKNIKAFLRDLLSIADYANSKKETSDVVSEIYEDLELLLENEGIEKINLNIGDKYDGNAKVVKIVSTMDTDENEKDNIVYSIKKDGYVTEITEGQIKVIRPVEIVLYKYEDK